MVQRKAAAIKACLKGAIVGSHAAGELGRGFPALLLQPLDAIRRRRAQVFVFRCLGHAHSVTQTGTLISVTKNVLRSVIKNDIIGHHVRCIDPRTALHQRHYRPVWRAFRLGERLGGNRTDRHIELAPHRSARQVAFTATRHGRGAGGRFNAVRPVVHDEAQVILRAAHSTECTQCGALSHLRNAGHLCGFSMRIVQTGSAA